MWRLFAAAACLAAGAAMAGVGTLAAGQGDDPFLARARALHLSVPMFDGHNDYPWEVRQRAGKDPAALDIRSARTDTMTDIPADAPGRGGCAVLVGVRAVRRWRASRR